MSFDLKQLEAYVSIIDNGGFGAASRVLHLSQAAVSERIANLENAVGIRLLDRKQREARPTTVGERFYILAKQLLDQRNAIELELAELAGVIRGTLNIGASTIPGEYILPLLLSRFCSEYPAIELNMHIHDSEEVMEDVLRGDVEAGIVGAVPADDQLRCEQLWSDRLLLVTSAGHRLSGRRRVKLAELTGEPFIMREQGSGTRRLMESVVENSNTQFPEVSLILGSTTAVKEAVIAGYGITLISERAVQREVEDGILAAMEMEGLKFERHFLLITDQNRTLSPLCKRFIEYLTDSYQKDVV